MFRTVPVDDQEAGEKVFSEMFGEVPLVKERQLEEISRGNVYKKSKSIAMKAFNVPKRDTMREMLGKNKPWYIISHENTWRCLFHYLMSLMLIESNIISLYWLAFGQPEGASLIYDTIMQVFFFIDFVLNFLTTSINKKEEITVSPILIGMKYCRRWMTFDLLALIPFRVVGLPSLEFFLRLSRIAKVGRVYLVIGSIEVLIVEILYILYPSKHFVKVATNAMMRMLNILLVMCFIIYFISCCFLRFTDYEPGNFREHYLSDYSNSKSLLWTAYFISTTIISVGYGDMLPQNSSERIAVIFIIIIGTGYYAVLAGGFNSVVATINSLMPSEDPLFDLNSWMFKLEKRFKPLSPQLRKRIQSHFKYYWVSDRLHSLAKEYWTCKNYSELLRDNCTYFGKLTPDLKRAILDSIFKEPYHKFSDFFGDTEMKYELSYHLQPRIYDKDEIMIGQGDQVLEMLFIMKGKVQAEWTSESTDYTFDLKIGVLILGDYEILHGKPCFVTYKPAVPAVFIPVEALALPKRAFKMIVQNGFDGEEKRISHKCEFKHRQIVKCLMDAKKEKAIANLDGELPELALGQSDKSKRRVSMLITDINQSKYLSNETNLQKLMKISSKIDNNLEIVKENIDRKKELQKEETKLPPLVIPRSKNNISK